MIDRNATPIKLYCLSLFLWYYFNAYNIINVTNKTIHSYNLPSIVNTALFPLTPLLLLANTYIFRFLCIIDPAIHYVHIILYNYF